MPEWLQSAVVALVPSLVVAVVTAYLTVRLSLRRFHSERWWERKAETYSRVVESLYHVKAYGDAMVREDLEGVQYTPEHKKRLREEYSAGHRELSKATSIGAYIICDDAAKVLDELRKRPRLDWDENPPWEVFEDDARAYGEALTKMREIAKKDLGVS
mgnify:CR=1 FL=1